jgi:hypothetical protein
LTRTFALRASAALALLAPGVAFNTCGSSEETGPSPTLATATITFTGAAGRPVGLVVEIADTPAARTRGLMFRETLDANAGMLFVWPEDTGSGFWMMDTTIPLSIAFISAAGGILDIQDMKPLDTTLHHSPEPFRYAVEANRGWFEENGIAEGDRVDVGELPR